ncbi:MFS transporter [Thermosporothrix hazakensis]|jgi:MFS family permease|uniref:MFS transporter n=1 Tax=Thermosporothrix hazakensis TaxID=644383 RepID=A0A326U9Z2_THEHA|nr:MFS transporter [Thermosporothrix hazakensis]PZW31183.1 MFS transporter [Thermosporothrix hazakensis]GCE50906.1 MFS transporter [Thermosporothrix hazakensis]
MSLRQVVVIVLGVLLNGLNSSMIAVALVPISATYHVNSQATAWLVSGLYLATSVAQPTMGRLADLLGPKRVFCFGLVLTGLAGLGAWFAPDLGWLIAARVVLGIGTSAAYPSGLALVRRNERDGEGIRTSVVLGAITISSQVCTAFGPSVGGFLITWFGWQSIFLVNVPVTLLGLLGALFWLPGDQQAIRGNLRSVLRSLDSLGIALFCAMMIALLFFLMRLSSGIAWGPLVIALLAGGLLFWREWRCTTPFIDIRMLASHGGLLMTYGRYIATYLVFYSVFYGYSQWLEQGRGLAPDMAGLVMLPVAAVGALTAALMTKKLVIWRGLLGGALFMLIGTGLLQLAGSTASLWLLALIAAVLGIPNGLSNVSNQNALYLQAPASQMGAAAGLLRTSQYVGAILASSLISINYHQQATDAGLHHLGLYLTGVSMLVLIVVLIDPKLRALSDHLVKKVSTQKGEKEYVRSTR